MMKTTEVSVWCQFMLRVPPLKFMRKPELPQSFFQGGVNRLDKIWFIVEKFGFVEALT